LEKNRGDREPKKQENCLGETEKQPKVPRRSGRLMERGNTNGATGRPGGKGEVQGYRLNSDGNSNNTGGNR